MLTSVSWNADFHLFEDATAVRVVFKRGTEAVADDDLTELATIVDAMASALERASLYDDGLARMHFDLRKLAIRAGRLSAKLGVDAQA